MTIGLLIGVISVSAWAQRNPQTEDNPAQVAPAQESQLELSPGRIRGWSAQTQMNASVPSGAPPLHITIGLGEVYTVPSGASRTFSYPNTAWVCFASTQDGGGSIRYSASSTTNLQLRYFAYIPEEIRQFYQVSLNRSLDYLSFVEQWLEANVRVPWGDFSGTWRWNLNLSLQSAGCHQFSSGCRDVSVDLTRNISGVGDAFLWAPRNARGDPVAARAVRQDRLNFRFNHNQQSAEQTVSVQNRYGSATATAGLISDNYPLGVSTLETHANYNTGVIMIDKLQFIQSVDPLGFPELGENEFVFKEQGDQVRLEVPFGCRVIYSPPGFLLFHPFWDALYWYARRMRGNTSFSFTHTAEAIWGYANLTNELFIAFRSQGSKGLLYQASLLPEWDRFGRHFVSLQFVPISFEDNFSPFDMGRAEFEVFFPATGTRHPPGATSEPAGLTILNWFYYYWRAMGSPAVVFTNQGPEYAGGFYRTGQPYVYVRNHRMNYTDTSFPLFAIRMGQCPQGTPRQVVTEADTLTIHGIHCFARTVYHEFGHKWGYETYWRFAGNAYDRIAHPRVGPDLDEGIGDNLLDAWEEAQGLCRYRRHTTDAYPSYARRGEPSDPEVMADVIAYGALLSAEIDPRTGTWRPDGLWRRDWSNIGLQEGNPIERFGAFPWKYSSTGGNNSTHSDLLTGWRSQ